MYLEVSHTKLKGEIPKEPWVLELEHMHGDATAYTTETLEYEAEAEAVVFFLVATLLEGTRDSTNSIPLSRFQYACVQLGLPTFIDEDEEVVEPGRPEYPTLEQIVAKAAISEDADDGLFCEGITAGDATCDYSNLAKLTDVTLTFEGAGSIKTFNPPSGFVEAYKKAPV